MIRGYKLSAFSCNGIQRNEFGLQDLSKKHAPYYVHSTNENDERILTCPRCGLGLQKEENP